MTHPANGETGAVNFPTNHGASADSSSSKRDGASADQPPPTPPGADLVRLAASAGGNAADLPPVHLWDPPYCGDIGMEIRADGTWFYQGTPIGRPAMVGLFSRILRKDEDGRHYLVTPVEKVLVHVETAPFLAIAVVRSGEGADEGLTFTTQLGDVVTADADHPIRLEEDVETGAPRPFVTVRGRLEALITRACFFDLVALAEEQDGAHGPVLVVRSRGASFALGAAEPPPAPPGGAL